MIACPYCNFPLTGTFSQKITTEDSFEVIRACTHCEAILRFDVTTIKKPKPSYRINKLKSAVTYCPFCSEKIEKSTKAHTCPEVNHG